MVKAERNRGKEKRESDEGGKDNERERKTRIWELERIRIKRRMLINWSKS